MLVELKILDEEFYKARHDGDNWVNHWLPTYATSGSCAVDLFATKDYTILPQERIKIPTGIAIHIGSGYMGLVAPRSGLGTKGLVLANTVGIIDSDYQGEIIISAWNSLRIRGRKYRKDYIENTETERRNTIKIKAGDRIAQMAIVPVVVANWVIVDEFTESTNRGQGGYGSTGS